MRFSLITSMVFCLFYTGYLTSFWVRIRLLKFPLAGFVAPQVSDARRAVAEGTGSTGLTQHTPPHSGSTAWWAGSAGRSRWA